MWWWCLLSIILGACIRCESCGSIYLNKWVGVNNIYHEVEAPDAASISLFTCSEWCMEKSSCMLMSWTPSSCWQVGCCGNLKVTGKVYDLKKDPVGRYLIWFCNICIVTHSLRPNISYKNTIHVTYPIGVVSSHNGRIIVKNSINIYRVQEKEIITMSVCTARYWFEKCHMMLYVLNYTGLRWAFPMDMLVNGILIGSINGTVARGIGLMAGRNGLALYTNGVDEYVNFGYQGNTCLGYFILCSRGWVSALWVQLENDGYAIIMDTGVFANRGMLIATNSKSYTSINIRFQSDNKKWRLSEKVTPAQGWIHVVATWRLCLGAKMYIDGKLVKTLIFSRNKTVPLTDARRFVLGANGMYNNMFKGALDELRVWDTVMSDEEVLALYKDDAGMS